MIRTRAALDAIPAYVPGRSADAVAADHQVDEVVKLSSNEAPFEPLPSAAAAIARAATSVNRYPDDASGALVEALAARAGVTTGQVLVGNGSVELCRLAMAATVDPGDEVVFAWPSFEAYPILALQLGARITRVALDDHGHDLDAMADAVGADTRVVFVCSPNNPTGTVVTGAALRAFVEAVPPECLVVVDEAYREFVTDPSAVDGVELLGTHPNVLVLRTFSKAYGLAALRVGYALGSEEVVGALRKMRLPFAVNALAQVAALASLEADDEMRARVAGVVAERERLLDALRARGLPVVSSQGNFLWLDVPDTAADLGRFSETAGVVLRPFAGTGVRATVGTPDENDRLVEVLDRAVHDGVIGHRRAHGMTNRPGRRARAGPHAS